MALIGNSKLLTRFLKMTVLRGRLWPVLLAAGAGEVIVGLIKPYIAGLAVDRAILPKDMRSFLILGAIGGAVFLLGELVSFVKTSCQETLRLRTILRLNRLVLPKIADAPLSWLREKTAGSHIFNLQDNIAACSGILVSIPADAIYLAARLALTIAVVFYLNWKLSLAALVLSLLVYLPSYVFNPLTAPAQGSWNADAQRLFAALEELLSKLLLVKAFGRERAAVRGYIGRLIKNIGLSLRLFRLNLLRHLAYSMAVLIAAGAVFLYGFFLVSKGRMTYGRLTALMIYLQQMISMQAELGSLASSVSDSMPAFAPLDAVLGLPAPAVGGRQVLRDGSVVLRNLSFGYRSGAYVLEDLCLEIRSGEHAVIMGESGSGKTTLALLLLALYRPFSGEIRIGAEDINELSVWQLKSSIAIALQEPFLWNDTIYRNISYAAPSAASGSVLRAAAAACVDEFARRFPQGFQTVVGENGAKLSRGQQQRIAVARALLKEPKILILDEALSSVEPAIESRIITNIRRLDAGMTLIDISHRPSPSVAADKIFVIKDKQAVRAA